MRPKLLLMLVATSTTNSHRRGGAETRRATRREQRYLTTAAPHATKAVSLVVPLQPFGGGSAVALTDVIQRFIAGGQGAVKMVIVDLAQNSFEFGSGREAERDQIVARNQARRTDLCFTHLGHRAG